jgi:hypothetical protein
LWLKIREQATTKKVDGSIDAIYGCRLSEHAKFKNARVLYRLPQAAFVLHCLRSRFGQKKMRPLTGLILMGTCLYFLDL